MRLHVDGLVGIQTDDDLRLLFEKMGVVSRATVTEAPASGTLPGYGFVDMPDEDEARAAILRFDGLEMHGFRLVVREIHDRLRD